MFLTLVVVPPSVPDLFPIRPSAEKNNLDHFLHLQHNKKIRLSLFLSNHFKEREREREREKKDAASSVLQDTMETKEELD